MKWEESKISAGILRIFLGLVFLSAGLFRTFNLNLAEMEIARLQLPEALLWLVIILEIIGGLCLLFNKYIKKVLIIFMVGLIVALIWGLFVNGQEMMNQAKELFVYNLNPTDFFLHITFLIIIITLWFVYRKT